MTARRVIKNFSKKGNTLLGVGCYSAAFALKDNDKVVKIGTDIADPWLDYHNIIVSKHTDSVHIPKIHSFYFDSYHEYYIAIMEKLEPLSFEDTPLVTLTREYLEGYYTKSEMTELLASWKYRVPDTKKYLEVLDSIEAHTTHFRDGTDKIGNSCEDEGYIESEHDRKLDLHNDNLMLRDETIVIIDPWCNVIMDDVCDLGSWADNTLTWSN